VAIATPTKHDLSAPPVDYAPLSVFLKFGFLAVLYLFLLWIARSALKDLRRTASPAPDATGFHQAATFSPRPSAADAWLLAERGGGLDPGERFDLIGGLSIGRSAEADVRIEDRYASGVHARIFNRDGHTYLEDMNSTNGTLLNDVSLNGEAELIDGDLIRIGDTEFRYEAHA
jgi:pSer/pThr/pTyr-binding forkhead associated (FHA) protein